LDPGRWLWRVRWDLPVPGDAKLRGWPCFM
jgi:hypothetical protein